MRKLVIAIGLLLVTLGLLGCSQAEPEVAVLPYYYGYITTDGVVFKDTDGIYSVLCDAQGKQIYLLKSQSVYDYHRFNEYGNYIVVGYKFSVYDKKGELLKCFEVDDAGGSREFEYESSAHFALPQSLDLSKAVLLLDMLNTQGRFQLLRADGSLLVEEKIPADYNVDFSGPYVRVGEDFVVANIYLYDNLYNSCQFAYLYDFSGQPLHKDKGYNFVYPLYDFTTQGDSAYFQAQYKNPQGEVVYDVLDAKGQVVLDGLAEVRNCSDNLFTVKKGEAQGIMNAAGEWVFKESLED